MEEITAKEYFESRLNALEKASTLAAENLKTRLDSLNEWRLQNKDERGHFISREVFDAKIEAMEKSRKDSISMWISLIALIVCIAGMFIK